MQYAEVHFQSSYSFKFLNSMTCDDLFKSSMTLGLAVTFENFQNRPCSKVFYRHQLWCPNASYSRCLITPLYLTLSLLCYLQ